MSELIEIYKNIDDDAWYNPLDEKIYYEGDVVPLYDFRGGLAREGEIIRLTDPGFDGVVLANVGGEPTPMKYKAGLPDELIIEWIVKKIPPNPKQFIVAPKAVAWGWWYAQGEMNRNEAIQTNHSGQDEDGSEWGMEA